MSRGNASQSNSCRLGFILACAIKKFVEGRCRLESTSGILGNKKWATRL